MPFTRDWLLEEHLVFVQFDENVSLEDVSALAEAHESWLASSTTRHMIHYILDTRYIKTYPRNILQIKEHFQSRLLRTHWAIFVTNDYFMKHLGDVFARFFKYRFKQSASVREACHFLQETENLSIPESLFDTLDDSRHQS